MGDTLGSLDHELIELELQLFDVLRFLEELLKWLAYVTFDEVFGETQLLKFSGTIDDWNCSFTSKLVLGDLEHFKSFILTQGDSNALTAVWPEVVVVDGKTFERFVSYQ